MQAVATGTAAGRRSACTGGGPTLWRTLPAAVVRSAVRRSAARRRREALRAAGATHVAAVQIEILPHDRTSGRHLEQPSCAPEHTSVLPFGRRSAPEMNEE